jgi:hypothetical protein
MSISFDINEPTYVARFFSMLEKVYGPAEAETADDLDEAMTEEEQSDLEALLHTPCAMSCYVCTTLGCTHHCTDCFENADCRCLCRAHPTERQPTPVLHYLAEDEADFDAYARRLPRDLFASFEIVEYGTQEMELDHTTI